MPFSWSDDYPARIGVMPRNGCDRDVRWFAVEPCYVFHTLNAYDDGNTVVLDACGMEPMFQRMVRPMTSSVPTLVLARTKETPGGISLTTTVFWAATGPRFVTVKE